MSGRLHRLRPRVEQHTLGPRVYFLGVRWHDWHLGAAILLALVGCFAAGVVHAGAAAVLAAFAGVWLIAKDWRDLTSHRRDTAAWRLGLHRHPHPLRTFRRADPLPLLAALAAIVVAIIDLLSALTPNIAWRGHLLLQVEAVQALRVFHAIAVPTTIALLITAYYLVRRRRRALWLAIALLLGLAVVNLLKGLDFEEAIGDVGVATLLWLGRGSFYVEHEPLPRRSALMRVPLVVAFGLLVSFLLVALGARHGGTAMLLRETGDLLLWQKGPIAFHDELGRLDVAVGVVGVATLAVAAYLLFRPLAAPRDLPDPEARQLARRLVRSHGSDTLAYFKLRADKRYLFSSDRRAFLGYRVESGVLVVSGEPVGPADALPDLLTRLGSFAERRGLKIAAVGVGAETKPLYEQLGLRSLYLGDEAIVETGSFSLEGRAIRKVRQSVSRLEKAGYRTELRHVEALDEAELAEVAAAAARWLGDEDERGFSMALDSRLAGHGETLLLLARDGDGSLRGLLHFVPTYGRDAVSLSMMRRDHETPNGLMEFMVVQAIEALRARGVEEVSLNFAAFARLIHSPRGPLERVVRRVLLWADGVFQIERLYRFNAKFAPRWEARYLMHEGGLALPRAALATMWVEGQLPKPRLRRRSTA